MACVLIVEDDEDIASVLTRGLQREGYDTLHALDYQTALTHFSGARPDAAIVDMMLGEESGSELVADMRARGVRIPIIILSALSRVEDRGTGLASGADDYVVKPFEIKELVARLKVQELRAAAVATVPGLDLISYNPEQRQVSGSGREVTLTEREGALLQYFLNSPDTLISRGALFDQLWAEHGGTTDNVVDVYIGYLRRKLSPMSDFGIELRTVRGKGFMLTTGVRQ